MDFGFGDFEDDLFENKVKKNTQDFNEEIKNYIPKHVSSKVKILIKKKAI